MIDHIEKQLKEPAVWMVTGCAGFIGSHIVERLLSSGQIVRGVDNFATGSQENQDMALAGAGAGAAGRFTFYEGDILDAKIMRAAADGAAYVINQAAFVSVPGSFKNPELTAKVNEEGFCAVARAAMEAGAKRVVYASSSAVYGDEPTLPKRESTPIAPGSPYARSKAANEALAARLGTEGPTAFVGLRYFNIFGPRQDPEGDYAAVIPHWVSTLLRGEKAVINGDPGITRDFTYIGNVVDANISAALADTGEASAVFNIADGKETSLEQLLNAITGALRELGVDGVDAEYDLGPARQGDIKRSWADISMARQKLGFEPRVGLEEGLAKTVRYALAASGRQEP